MTIRTCALCRCYHEPFAWCGATERRVETAEAAGCALYEDRDFAVHDGGYVMPDAADDEHRASVGKQQFLTRGKKWQPQR